MLMNVRFPILAALVALLLAVPGRAQNELSPANPFNGLTQGTAFGPAILSQFSSVGTTHSGATNVGGVLPQGIYRDAQGQTVSASTITLRTGPGRLCVRVGRAALLSGR